MGKSETPWQALCNFAADPNYYKDPRETWEILETTKPPAKKRSRKRKMTLDRAMRQVDKAGLRIASATLTPEGVKLELGEVDQTANPWDSIQ